MSEFYKLDKDLLKADVILFNNFKAKAIIPDLTSASEIYESLYKDDLLRMVPELSKVLKIFAVIPATTCTAERSFSSLRQMKSYLRSRMGQTKLNSIALLNIERKYANKVLEHDIDIIIDAFAKKKNRQKHFF